jgi:hypothetical protein
MRLQLSPHNRNPKSNLWQLISSLGYCCWWAFFRRNKRTGMIATRLGCSDRAVRYQKARFKAGERRCENCEGCLKRKGVV